MRETWYVLEDGSVADPRECAPDKKGVLMHKSGGAVEMRGDVPRSRGVDLDPDGRPPADSLPAKTKQFESPSNREMKAESGPKKYKTR